MEEFPRIRRLPPYVFASINELKLKARREGEDIVDIYKKRRDVLIEGLNRIGWKVEKPKRTMFVWAKIPDGFQNMDSLEFSRLLLDKAKMAALRKLDLVITVKDM